MLDQGKYQPFRDRFALLKVVGLMGWTALMLGAHHNSPAPQCPPTQCTSILAVANESINAGHPDATTNLYWKATRSFRRVAAPEWGRFRSLDSAELLTVLKINRVDERHARRGNLIVPDSIGPELEYSPLPDSLSGLAAVPKFMLVSRQVQAFGAYENGRLVHWGPISSGKATTPTDSGLFFTNWKSRTAISTVDPSWILDWYVNFIAMEGVAFHQYDLPGRPASHGCVRLLESDAQWVYRWTEQWIPGRGPEVTRYGTPVLVFGDYDYTAPPPWQRLAEDPSADRLTAIEVELALQPNLQIIAQRIPVIAPLVTALAVERSAP
jgi:L,D-transpeptidase catalytic domain